jgi:hypothetical protein
VVTVTLFSPSPMLGHGRPTSGLGEARDQWCVHTVFLRRRTTVQFGTPAPGDGTHTITVNDGGSIYGGRTNRGGINIRRVLAWPRGVAEGDVEVHVYVSATLGVL